MPFSRKIAWRLRRQEWTEFRIWPRPILDFHGQGRFCGRVQIFEEFVGLWLFLYNIYYYSYIIYTNTKLSKVFKSRGTVLPMKMVIFQKLGGVHKISFFASQKSSPQRGFLSPPASCTQSPWCFVIFVDIDLPWAKILRFWVIFPHLLNANSWLWGSILHGRYSLVSRRRIIFLRFRADIFPHLYLIVNKGQ